MQGAKRDVLEGGIRNFLSVKGPGVAQGAIRDELLGVIDVLPTMVQLARIQMVRSAAAAAAAVAAADYGVDGRWRWRWWGAAGPIS
jgi:arylsulfatase A-like enzyme